MSNVPAAGEHQMPERLADNGWTIRKDPVGHGGREWKLRNTKAERAASLGKDGEIIGA